MGTIQKKFTVNLSEAEVIDDSDRYIQMSLSDLNNGETSFYPGDDVYIDIFRWPDDEPINSETTHGNFKAIATKIPESFSTQLIFHHSDEGQLTYTADAETIEFEWEGENETPVGISVEGRTITLNKEVCNILNVTYTTFKDIYLLSDVDEIATVLLCASLTDDDPKTNMTVQFGIREFDPDFPREPPDDPEDPPDNPPEQPDDPDPPSDGTDVTVGWQILSCETGEPVAGVQFYVENQSIGVSDSDGMLPNSTEHVTGEVVSIRATGSGIIDSDLDAIENDEITI